MVVFGIHALPNRWFAEFEVVTAELKIAIMNIMIIAHGDNPLTIEYAYRDKMYPLGNIFLFGSGFFVLGSTFYFRTQIVDLTTADLKSGRRPLTEAGIEFLDNYYHKPLYRRTFAYITI
ncbi:hypothetical protein SCUCBS95973_004466 [Sporothrix curviconia]|uniref:Uncharacterized protein n=1 Tax=Sporothrix curviconia TaxID=1260050 RepID=A0ABP0BPI0_9PEZI